MNFYFVEVPIDVPALFPIGNPDPISRGSTHTGAEHLDCQRQHARLQQAQEAHPHNLARYSDQVLTFLSVLHMHVNTRATNCINVPNTTYYTYNAIIISYFTNVLF